MKTFVALVRGINLVGRNRLPMAELKRLVEESGCSEVRTYIQSGNVLFCSRTTDAARLEKRIADAVATSRGFTPRVLVLTRKHLEKAAAGNPFPKAVADPKSLHVFFLETAPKTPDLARVEAVREGRERWALKDRYFYLWTPDGFGKSKLAEKVERLLGVAATARNWRTVTTLIEMTKA